MRHQKVGRKLSRTASHRRQLLSALSTALIKHKKITTTTAKAKETRRIVEPIITRARGAYLSEKAGNPVDVHARRVVARFIRDKDALHTLFTEVAEKVGKRPGGYTRVLALGNRIGDGAAMSIIELVDYNEAQDTKKRATRVAKSKQAQQRRKVSEEVVEEKPKRTRQKAAKVVEKENTAAPLVDEVQEVDVVETEANEQISSDIETTPEATATGTSESDEQKA